VHSVPATRTKRLQVECSGAKLPRQWLKAAILDRKPRRLRQPHEFDDGRDAGQTQFHEQIELALERIGFRRAGGQAARGLQQDRAAVRHLPTAKHDEGPGPKQLLRDSITGDVHNREAVSY
jgi:hypothetical protein